MAARALRRARTLPAYALYGEPQQPGLPELHLEAIAHRSRVHDWEIRPHRHAALFQLLVVAQGPVQAQLDEQQLDLQGPCAITVPAMAVHGFRFAPVIDGMVLTLSQRHLHTLLAGHDAWRDTVDRLRALAPVPPAVLLAATALRDEVQQPGPWCAVAVDTALRRLLLELARAAPDPQRADAALPPRALQHVQRYQALVDARFRQQPGVDLLAQQLGITPTQLNRVCRQVLGQPALAVLHARLLLEAQRELVHTGLSIKQIAMGLGFADAGYFTRFHRRLTGQSPSGFRERAHQTRSLSSPALSDPRSRRP